MESKETPKKEVATSVISKGIIQEAFLRWLQDEEISKHACQNLKAYMEALTVFSQVFSPTPLSFKAGCLKSFYCGNRGNKVGCKDRGGGDEPPIAWVQLTGQLAVMSV